MLQIWLEDFVQVVFCNRNDIRARILAVEPGGSAREGQMHLKFAACNVRGPNLGVEHFTLTPELLAHINSIREQMGTFPVAA